MAPGTMEETKSAALNLIRQRQFEEALVLLESIGDGDPSELLDVYEMQAMCYFRTKQYEQACTCYQQLAEEHPQSATPLTNLGAVYNRMKKFPEAVSSLRNAIQRDKHNFDAYYNLGFAHRNSGHPELAIPAYKEAIKLNPQFDQAHLNLANAYLDVNNNRQAVIHYQTALNINPDLEAATRGLKKAQDREIQSAKNTNPFGRLVDVTQLSHRKSASAIKTLNIVEREKDRQEVQRIAKAIRNAARHVSEEVREKMEPALLALTRALIDGENHPEMITQYYNQFHAAIPKFEEGRRYLKRSVLELRGHEEPMNTPDLDF
ncbi:tetratricopeptide repeat protein [Rubinisphaera italica]|uniref:Photosystem I assembly protein Ycf3 n=1 Tax=Rubinisphaera italica TaxID=2527969 RepID=A0A5C5XJN9_9PLAN|nr:tetratricopeptide repeat protein [Rubinisphaera italica]TWT62591.1 photosystem I assembly protein Ycf3 [Rubinisphaera italica]